MGVLKNNFYKHTVRCQQCGDIFEHFNTSKKSSKKLCERCIKNNAQKRIKQKKTLDKLAKV